MKENDELCVPCDRVLFPDCLFKGSTANVEALFRTSSGFGKMHGRLQCEYTFCFKDHLLKGFRRGSNLISCDLRFLSRLPKRGTIVYDLKTFAIEELRKVFVISTRIILFMYFENGTCDFE